MEGELPNLSDGSLQRIENSKDISVWVGHGSTTELVWFAESLEWSVCGLFVIHGCHLFTARLATFHSSLLLFTPLRSPSLCPTRRPTRALDKAMASHGPRPTANVRRRTARPGWRKASLVFRHRADRSNSGPLWPSLSGLRACGSFTAC